MRVAIVIAAGSSRRFTGGNKLLVRVAGKPLLAHAAAAARLAPVGRVIVVTGHDAARVARVARGPRTVIVRAQGHRQGLSASLKAGFAALRPIERAVFVFLADVPAVPRALPHRLVRALRPGVAAVRVKGRAGPGHPVLLRRPSREIIARLSGDTGLGALIPGCTRWLPSGRYDAADIDTRHDLARWRRQKGTPWKT